MKEDKPFIGLLKLLSVIVLCVAVVLGYWHNPTIFTNLVEFWVGSSEHWDGSGSHPIVHSGSATHLPADIPRRDAVVDAFKHAWLAYEKDAMGDDEYHPISHKGSNLTNAGGIGYTVIDSIDTILLMGLTTEYARARAWVTDRLSFKRDGDFNTFETTIRVLGGLLSAYHLSNEDPLYLERAVELADRILPAFETHLGLPLPMVNLGKRQGVFDKDLRGLVSTAEVATLQLEFRYLSHLTDDDVYWRRVENVMRIIKNARLPHGLASIYMSLFDGQYVTSAIRLGSRGDSYYEYLLKQYIQTMYDDAMTGIHNHLIQKGTKSKMTYTAELVPEQDRTREIPSQIMALDSQTGSSSLFLRWFVNARSDEDRGTGKRDWKNGVELIKTCMATHDTATGLSPEIVHFRIPSDGLDSSTYAPADWYIKGARPGESPPYDARYMLRPETVESLFLAYRLTGDQLYRDHGWKIFQSIEKHCKIVTGGYATVVNVDENPVRHEDKMETFLMSETLKYLYLLFDDSDTLPLDKYVFNTEAHPLPIFEPTIRTGFS
ncbi:Mannosyl-oligosaccharide 1,2-alpha-mannosidase MNS3 [Termitomyces sp. J132]|nr:Mannosyl-oligosaccharide 1,2-alpha-mannosidase MNS3 [Termitomyces sp. J132]